MVGVDGAQGGVLASLQNAVLLTHAGFSIASEGSPWRLERERGRDEWWLLGSVVDGSVLLGK